MGKLTARKVQTARPGKYGDGLGLWLRVRKDGTKSWVLRYMLAGRSREMGLGPIHTISLAQARVAATKCREQLLAGIDPIDERQRERTAALGRMTFKECAEQFLKAHESSWSNPKHRKQWSSTLEIYAFPRLGDLPVNAIGTSEVMRALEPIWREKTETASRLRGRIERVLDWAKVREYRDGDNPARWRGHLDQLLPAPSKIAPVKHHPALPFAETPSFMATLREQKGVAARALEFTILTAARSGEVRGMKWSELDGEIWIVPAERMKANKEHRVPLPERVLAVIEEMRRHGEAGFVFGSQIRAGKPLSDMSLLAVLKRMGRSETVHGFRSTFRDWVAERTAFPSDVAEAALAHTISSKVQAAYQRGDLFEKRCKLMAAWADYCERGASRGGVIPVNEQRKKKASKIREFIIPDDLPLMQALGAPVVWTARELQRRLEYLSTCIEHDIVPNARGRFRGLADVPTWSCPSPGSNAERRLLGVFKRGKRQWESVPVPPELEKSMAGLAEAVAAVRELLETGEIGKAGQRMVGIEVLVADMVARGAPVTEQGRRSGAKGGEMKRGKYTEPPSELRDAVRRKLTEKPEHSLTNARRLVARDKGVSVSTVRRHTKGISSKKTELK